MKVAIKFDENGEYISHCTDLSITRLDDIRPSGEGFAFYETELNIAEAYYFRLSGNSIVIDEKLKAKEIELVKIEQLKAEIHLLLNSLSQDLVQALAGEVVPNIEQRKAEFVQLHNELRVLLGKPPRVQKVEV